MQLAFSFLFFANASFFFFQMRNFLIVFSFNVFIISYLAFKKISQMIWFIWNYRTLAKKDTLKRAF